jgi:hypothetical protein
LTSGVDEPTTLGRTRQHPEVPERWGLHNTSDFAWQVSYPGGQQHTLEPNQTIEMIEDARIQIGSATVSVRRP